MSDAAEWYDVLGRFKAKFAELLNVYQKLLTQENDARKNPQLYAEWQALKNRGDTIMKTAQNVNSQISSGMQWLNETFGISLGALPAIPIAIGAVGVAGAVAVITAYISSYMEFNARLAIFQQTGNADVLKQTGLASGLQSAADILKNIWPLALLGAGVYFGPKIIKSARRGR